MADWDSKNYKAGQLRWIKMAQERHQHVAHEEKRKEEVLGIFEDLVELSSKERAKSLRIRPWRSRSDSGRAH